MTTRMILRQQRGRNAEQLAAAFLRHEGYQIHATNVRFPVGELDIVAQEGDTLCFVEVRSRADERFGPAQESITWSKRRHFLKAVQWYLQRRRVRWAGPVRFDLVAINDSAARHPKPELLRHAFDAGF